MTEQKIIELEKQLQDIQKEFAEKVNKLAEEIVKEFKKTGVIA